jgi:ribosomal protein S18 acetylase RimI-like enzyme
MHLAGRRRTVLLGNGVDVHEFDPESVPEERLDALRSELGIPGGSVVVGTVGRLVAEKGYQELFEAAATVRSRTSNVVFVVVGGTDNDKWDSLSRTEIRKARNDVIFAGHRDDVRDLLALMDIFVLPSWREGLPRSAIEAATMGRALVLTDIRGCREVVRDGKEGLLVPPRNVEALADAIGHLVADSALRLRLGTAARLRAHERFDERSVERALLREYRMLAERKGLLNEEIEGYRLRRASLDDVPMLAEYHRRMFETGFLPKLGTRFLQVLYTAFVSDPETVAIVLEENGAMVGFVTGSVSVSALYRRFFRHHAAPAFLAAIPALTRHPISLYRAWETARYASDTAGFPEAELFTIGVTPAARGRGIGGLLGQLLVEELGELGADRVRCTVGPNNAPMNRLMQRTGWQPAGDHSVHHGITSIVYVKKCPSS